MRRNTTFPPMMVVSAFTLQMASDLRSKMLSLERPCQRVCQAQPNLSETGVAKAHMFSGCRVRLPKSESRG